MNLIKFFTNTRVYVASIFLIVTLSCILAGGLWLAGFIMILCILGSKEFVILAEAKGHNPNYKMIMFAEVVLFALCYKSSLYKYTGVALTMLIIAAILVIMSRGKKGTIEDTAITIFGFIYGGWFPAHIVALRDITGNGFMLFNHHFNSGLGYIVLMFLIISVSDIAGYYVGSNFGKMPLCPEISPKKTVAGAIGSTVGCILVAVIFGRFIALHWYQSLIAGFLLSAAAQLGDLAESMMKRDAGVKDSSDLIPGHGGVLDRADSYIFTGAVAFYFFKIFVVGM